MIPTQLSYNCFAEVSNFRVFQRSQQTRSLLFHAFSLFPYQLLPSASFCCQHSHISDWPFYDFFHGLFVSGLSSMNVNIAIHTLDQLHCYCLQVSL